ncbi:MAG: hypothetical protein Q4Q23_03865 [Methanobacteriaceae archaeon]|nr:hypothetical protein [Methanobacteriaceae archaeon]
MFNKKIRLFILLGTILFIIISLTTVTANNTNTNTIQDNTIDTNTIQDTNKLDVNQKEKTTTKTLQISNKKTAQVTSWNDILTKYDNNETEVELSNNFSADSNSLYNKWKIIYK